MAHEGVKDILIVSSAFYPVNTPRAFRTTELAKELARKGCNVKVIVPKDEEVHPDFEKKHGIRIKDLGSVNWKPLSLNGNFIARNTNRLFNRVLEQFFYYPRIEYLFRVTKALKNEKGYDLLISIASPHSIHWGIARNWRKGSDIAKKWIADCGDPFMFSTNLQYKRPFYFKFLEKNFCKKADFVTIPFEGAKDGYYKEFKNKLQVVPQGFKFEDIKTCSQEKPNEVTKIAYAGSLVPKRRDPRELLDYLITQGHDFQFFLYSKNFELLKQYKERYPDKIQIMNFKDRLTLLKELSVMDFMVNFENVGSTQLPSKLIDYAIIGKPILSVKYGKLDTTIVEEFMKGDYSNGFEVSNLDDYRIENVAEQFLALANNKTADSLNS